MQRMLKLCSEAISIVSGPGLVVHQKLDQVKEVSRPVVSGSSDSCCSVSICWKSSAAWDLGGPLQVLQAALIYSFLSDC